VQGICPAHQARALEKEKAAHLRGLWNVFYRLGLCRECCLGLIHDRTKCLWLVYGKVCQYFAVNFDTRKR
jgi:hypothetical protein